MILDGEFSNLISDYNFHMFAKVVSEGSTCLDMFDMHGMHSVGYFNY